MTALTVASDDAVALQRSDETRAVIKDATAYQQGIGYRDLSVSPETFGQPGGNESETTLDVLQAPP
jgi:hypothetical protein